jgi:hypothetical protein
MKEIVFDLLYGVILFLCHYRRELVAFNSCKAVVCFRPVSSKYLVFAYYLWCHFVAMK